MFAANTDVSAGKTTKLIRLARLARFARLFRLAKLANLRKFSRLVNKRLRKIGMTKPGMEFAGRIGFLGGVVLLITHVVACLWINLSRERTKLNNDHLVWVNTIDGELVQVYNNWYARRFSPFSLA